MRISTKKGDNGETSLLNGWRLKKSEPVFCVLGDLDELNCAVGLAKVACGREPAAELEKIQEDIYRMMAIIGNEMRSPKGIKRILEEDVSFLEKNIEKIEGKLGMLKSFVKPGVNEASARLHLARSVCRRAERGVVANMESLKISPEILKYLNRLSDLLFLMGEKFGRMRLP